MAMRKKINLEILPMCSLISLGCLKVYWVGIIFLLFFLVGNLAFFGGKKKIVSNSMIFIF
jgi:hypothetical protein